MTEFNVICACGFQSDSARWGRVVQTSTVFLTGYVPSTGKLVEHEMSLDEPPLTSAGDDKFERMDWFLENGPSMVASLIDPDAIMIGPNSEDVACPSCCKSIARSNVVRRA